MFISCSARQAEEAEVTGQRQERMLLVMGKFDVCFDGTIQRLISHAGIVISMTLVPQ